MRNYAVPLCGSSMRFLAPACPRCRLIDVDRYAVGVDWGAPQLGQTVGLPTTGWPQFQQGLLLPNACWLGDAGTPYGVGCAPCDGAP